MSKSLEELITLMPTAPDTIIMSPQHYKVYFREAFPNRFALYAAGWKSGFTVNNIMP